MKQLIYSIEDDLNIQNVIQIALQNSNFKVSLFSEAASMFKKLENEKPDLFLLDIMLPNMNGLEILKKLKSNLKHRETPIMIISAKSSEIDKVIGLDIGADDYLIKPFGVLELISRAKALLRRKRKTENINAIIIAGQLVINPKKYSCTYNNIEISFTKKQFDLLKLLVEQKGNIVSRDSALNIIWGYDFVGETRTLDVHIKEIRRKLRNAGAEDYAIETVRGVGYKYIL